MSLHTSPQHESLAKRKYVTMDRGAPLATLTRPQPSDPEFIAILFSTVDNILKRVGYFGDVHLNKRVRAAVTLGGTRFEYRPGYRCP